LQPCPESGALVGTCRRCGRTALRAKLAGVIFASPERAADVAEHHGAARLVEQTPGADPALVELLQLLARAWPALNESDAQTIGDRCRRAMGRERLVHTERQPEPATAHAAPPGSAAPWESSA